jgi:hypothetical protein
MSSVISPWRCPILVDKVRHEKVIIYCFNNQWNPIFLCCLADAVEFYYQAAMSGQQTFIFSRYLNPDHFQS